MKKKTGHDRRQWRAALDEAFRPGRVKKMPRLVYEVRFEDGRWRLFAPDGQRTEIGQFGKAGGSKTNVVLSASAVLTYAHRDLHVLSELVIKTKGGDIQDKRTYGEDPRRTRG